jgi:hypothetical protein
MANKKIIITDVASTRCPGRELIRLEQTFGRFRNEFLYKYEDKIDWIIAGCAPIHSSFKHQFFKLEITNADVERAKIKDNNNDVIGEYAMPIVSLLSLSEKVNAKLAFKPDLIICTSDDNRDWADYDALLATMPSDDQSRIRDTTFLLNLSCFDKSIIIPQIIAKLGLNE